MGSPDPFSGGSYIAAIDLGSHTARFLVCRIFEPPHLFRPVIRKRFYTNLAEGFDPENSCVINSDSFNRAVNAIEQFKKVAEKYGVDRIVGAATGVFRKADNSSVLLNEIKERTGVEIMTVSGEKEADLTIRGIFHGLGLSDYPDVFFDLGGSTTEFIYNKSAHSREVISLPVGAFVLNDMFFKHDPPAEKELAELKNYITGILKEKIVTTLKSSKEFTFIGSGGTVTSLSAMVKNLDKKDVTPDAINGSLLVRDSIHELYNNLRLLPISDRCKIKSIDEGRAEVILAGTLAVITIMEFFNADNLTVSYSDILEGLILSYIEGEKDE